MVYTIFWILGSGYWILDIVSWISYLKFGIVDLGYWVFDIRPCI